MPQAVFIDFDGTFADHGDVPTSHIRAVQTARENGHHVLLCTGRPRSLVRPYLLESVFDGMVGAAGGYVEIQGTVLEDVRFPPDVATRTLAELTRCDAVFVLEAPEAVYGPIDILARLQRALGKSTWAADTKEGATGIFSALRPCDDLDAHPFGKVSVFDAPIPVDDIAASIGEAVGSLPNSITGIGGYAGEIFLRGVHKAVGVALAAAHLGVAMEDVIGIGDGYNDYEMLAEAGTAVVVEDAPPEVLALADLVIAGPSKGGVAQAFAELQLTP